MIGPLVNEELNTMWKEAVTGLIWGTIQAFVIGWLRETTKKLSLDSQCPDLEMYQAPPDYK